MTQDIAGVKVGEIDLQSVKAAALKATPGPWATKKHGGKIRVLTKDQGITVCNMPIGYMTPHREDADYVALANPSFVLGLIEEVERLRVACKRAEQFIVNGTELGFIRMPDPDSGDPALDTLSIIQAALNPERREG